MKPTLFALGSLCCMLMASAASAAELEAELRWSRLTAPGLSVSGVVEKVAVAAGQRVKQGELLLKLDQRHLHVKIKQAEAAETAAQLTLQEADKELERAQELYDRTVLSDHELLQARAAQARAVSELQRASSQLLKSRMQLQYSELKAPFAARILRVDVAEGEAVASRFQAHPLLAYAEDQAMLAEAPLTAGQARELQIGQTVKVQLGKQRYTGKVVAISIDEKNQRRLQVRFTSSEKHFFAGEKASIIY